MDREGSLRALSEYNNKEVCIHCSHKRRLSDFCTLSLTSPKAGSRQQKKSSRKPLCSHSEAEGRRRICTGLKDTTQEIPVGTKKPGGGGARGHILSAGTEVLQLRVCWKPGNCTMLGNKAAPTAKNKEHPLLAQLQTRPPF